MDHFAETMLMYTRTMTLVVIILRNLILEDVLVPSTTLSYP